MGSGEKGRIGELRAEVRESGVEGEIGCVVLTASFV